MPRGAVRVITFDLDDTLWEVAPVITAAETAVFDWLQQHAPRFFEQFSAASYTTWRQHYQRQRREFDHQISAGRRAAMHEALQLAGYDARQSSALAETAFEVFIAARHRIAPFAPAEAMLQSLRPHYRLGVLTNGNADIFRLPLGQYFDFAFRAEQLNASKPSPDHFLAASRHTETPAASILHVGDHWEHDVQAALNAGCQAVWFNRDGVSSDSDAASALNTPIDPAALPLQVSCLSELPALIAGLNRRGT